MVKRLLFAEGLVGFSEVEWFQQATWQDRAVAALRPGSHVAVGGVRLVWGGSGARAVALPLGQRTPADSD
eukprot:359593-Chlamydomonas_euryale.AAC.4